MNPLVVLPMLAYSVVAVLWQAQVDGHRRGRLLLFVETLVVIALIALGRLMAGLATPSSAGLRWGTWMLLATAYLYVCGRGMVLVRSVLELSVLRLRREDDRGTGAIEVSRGRAIGVLERAVALTLVLLGQYGALGLVIAAKSIARFKALEDREFAEYFLIGTLTSLLIALLGGIALHSLLPLP